MEIMIIESNVYCLFVEKIEKIIVYVEEFWNWEEMECKWKEEVESFVIKGWKVDLKWMMYKEVCEVLDISYCILYCYC